MYYFVSDIHLKNDDEEKAKVLISFLDSLNSNTCNELFLLGDIFDLWVANHSVFIKKYRAVVDAIAACVNKGIKVHYFEGNHDLYLDKYWEQKIGVKIYKKDTLKTLGSLVVRLEHGDQTNPADLEYLKYRAFLATPFMNRMAYIIPGKLLDYFGNRASNKSRGENHQAKWNIKNILRAHIERVAKEQTFDVIITGHLHERLDESIQINNKTIRNINLGWWKDDFFALKLENDAFEWIDLKESQNHS